MNTYIVEVPDGGAYRKLEVQGEWAGESERGCLSIVRGDDDAVAAFRDWICFYRKEAGGKGDGVTFTVNLADALPAKDVAKIIRDELSRSGRFKAV